MGEDHTPLTNGQAAHSLEAPATEQPLSAVYRNVHGVLAGTTDLQEAAPRVLRSIAEPLRWKSGVIWSLDTSAGVLRCVDVWTSPEIDGSGFEAASREQVCGPGQGFPGQVWRRGRATWLSDLGDVEDSLRSVIAGRQGLRQAVGIPLSVGGEIIGVVEFWSDAIGISDEDQLAGLDIVGGYIAQFLRRHQTDSALREYGDRLRLALEVGQMGTWNWDIRTNRVHWSPRLEAIHGLPQGSFPGTFEAFQQDIHPDDRDRLLAAVQKALGSGKDYHIEYRLVLPDATVRWVEARGTVLRDDSGQPVQMMGVCTEVTERKQAEEDLRFLAVASRSLATLADFESTLQRIASLAVPNFADWCVVSLPDETDTLRQAAVAHVDPDKVQLAVEMHRRWPPSRDAQTGTYQVFRTGRPMMIEQVTEEMLQQHVRDQEQCEILRTIGMKSYMCVPLVVRDKIIGVMSFVTAESGRIYSQADLSLAEDLGRRAAIASENAKLYAKLQDEGRKKDEFLAMLAHELRNPLAPIRSGLDVLRILGTDGEILDTMQQQVEHLVRLVDDLLDLSRIMRGKVDLRREPVQLSCVVERATDAARPLISSHRQHLSVNLPVEPVWLDVDPVRLTQVVGNLLNNASKYTETRGRIAISAETQGSHVMLHVRDSGIGISHELLPRVFDLFTQEQRTIDRAQGGLGIGLTVVKSLVEMHGGTVTVHSAGPGHGSEFTIRLPMLMHSPRTPLPSPELISTRALRVLVVDDNVSAAKMLSLLLTKLGNHQVVMAHDGVAAVAAAKQQHPDLILLDIGLPRMDGYEVARMLRKESNFAATLVVALTGYGTEEDRQKSLDAGCDEHLVKPPGVQSLRELLMHPKLPNLDAEQDTHPE